MSYVALANITLGSSASSVTFSSIPNTFRDLVLVARAIRPSTEADIRLSFNDNTTNFSRVFMFGTGSGSGSSGASTSAQTGFSSTEGVLNHYQIMDYSATDKHKPILVRWNFAGAYVLAQASRWADTSAVNKIILTDDAGGTFSANSTFALYGIAS